jgi:8-oxo-dGTP pyrophosphatase MutT (NUDIX family)
MKQSMTKIKDDLYYDERSAGGIVYKIEKGETYWLLIKTIRAKKFGRMGVGGSSSNKVIYKFPKGHLDSNEFLKQAALREVEEEGRVKAEIIGKIGSRDYIMVNKWEKKKTIKRVTFFLMKYLGDSSLRHFDKEVVLDRLWLTYKEACNLLTYDSEKILLTRAKMKFEKIK